MSSVVRSLTAASAATIGVAALILGVSAPASVAASTITRDTVVTPISDQGIPDDCRPGITGTLVGTDTLEYQSVKTPDGFHFVGRAYDAGRITWSDGTYSVIESVDRFAFNTGMGATVNTNAHEDSGDTYSADGVFLYRTTFHLVEHFTEIDGVLKVQFERDHFHFFGGPCG